MNDLTAIAVFVGCLLVTLALVWVLEHLRPRDHGQSLASDRTVPGAAAKEKHS